MRYPAPGAQALHARISALLTPEAVRADDGWGYDHGTWSVLAHMYPDADIPVAQLSLDRRLTAEQHYELARKLRPLRDEGVLILGSGDIVHNLRALRHGPPHDWAQRFDDRIQTALAADDIETVAAIEADEDARLSVPDHEHYWPILYVAAQREAGEPLRFFNQGIDMGAISMTSFVVG